MDLAREYEIIPTAYNDTNVSILVLVDLARESDAQALQAILESGVSILVLVDLAREWF